MNDDTFWRDKAFKHDFVTSSALPMWLATLIWTCLQLLSGISHWATHHTYICRCSEKGRLQKDDFSKLSNTVDQDSRQSCRKTVQVSSLGAIQEVFPHCVEQHHVAERDPEGKRLPCCPWSFYSQESRQLSWLFLFLVARLLSFAILALRHSIDEPSFSTCSACQTSYALLPSGTLCLRICSVK